MIAISTVHTTGINWGSVALIVCTTVGCFVGVASWIVTRIDKGRDRTQTFVSLQVKAVTDVLDTRLTNLVNVTDRRLARIERKIDEQNGKK